MLFDTMDVSILTKCFCSLSSVLEAQDRATKQRLRELNKAEGLYKDWLGLKFKNIGGKLKTIAVNKVTNRWRNHNKKTTKISELNKIIELYEL